jgi:anti-sigma factor RsiW
MCDVHGKLVAWLDRELSQDEAAEVERHVERCAECRSECQRYERVSETFEAYCDAVVAAKTHRRVPRWVPALAGAVVAVAVAVVFLSFPRARVEPRPVPARVAAIPVTVLRPTSAPGKKVHTPHPPVARIGEQVARWRPAESAVQIAIPAEAMFPPGAMPEGMSFIAEVSIGADGSVERVRLRP